MKTTQTLPQVKDCGTSGKCDSFVLIGELCTNQTAVVCLLNECPDRICLKAIKITTM